MVRPLADAFGPVQDGGEQIDRTVRRDRPIALAWHGALAT